MENPSGEFERVGDSTSTPQKLPRVYKILRSKRKIDMTGEIGYRC